jgi:hypothetical protein
MTHYVLPTDIELATKLLAANRPDEAVVAALVRRGIDSAGATQLVADLRNGRKVSPQLPSGLEIGPGRRTRSKRAARPSETSAPSPAPESSPRRERRTQGNDKNRKHPTALWIIAAIPICFGAVVIGVLISNRLHRAGNNPQPEKPRTGAPARALAPPAGSSQESPRPGILAGSRSTAAGQSAVRKPSTGAEQSPTSGLSSAPDLHSSPPRGAVASSERLLSPQLVLEFQTDGLHIGGSLVTPGNALACVSKILGAPTRTSPAAQPDTTIYAYDKHGLLIYSGKGTGKESIILDCEASGGENGTTSPFTGLLQVEDQVIRPATDSNTLAAIKQLGISNPSAGGGILSGRCHNLVLTFAYLKTPQRLSLIEIDLK